MKKNLKICSIVLLFMILFTLPNFSHVFAAGLVNCGTGTYSNSTNPALDCDFEKFIEMINTLINWLIMIALPLAAIAFAWAGWLYLSAGENPGKVGDAKKIFWDVGIGLVIILSGWLVFTLISDNFLDSYYATNNYLIR